nr:receptor-type tyrosine-protein phosphatase eta-like [Danio rerio]|eukprot:XP_021326226.1 receptor-type tyrosine-protein phosphatase eta-like [Danio rerio]
MIFGITSMVFFYSRREVVKHCQDIPVHTITNIALRIEEYEEYFKQKCADSNHGFAIEYEELRFVGTAQANTAALALENKEKNRYLNVLPCEYLHCCLARRLLFWSHMRLKLLSAIRIPGKLNYAADALSRQLAS